VATATVLLALLAIVHPSYALPGLGVKTPAKAGEVKCQHVTAAEFRRFSGRVWRLEAWRRGRPPTKVIRAQRGKLRCAAGPGHRRSMRKVWRSDRAAYLEHRDRKRHPWVYAFEALSEADQAWAIATGSCESGNVATTDTGNGFLGAFQWVLSTWWAAGGSGSPTEATWHEQAVRAVRWRNIAGAGQWPVCGV
jgi:hypothetical protein